MNGHTSKAGKCTSRLFSHTFILVMQSLNIQFQVFIFPKLAEEQYCISPYTGIAICLCILFKIFLYSA